MNQENQLTEQNSEETEIDLLEIFYLLRAKLVWLILAFVIGGVIAGSITHFLITPKYTATAKMYMISASSGSVLDLSDFNIGTSLSQDYTELIKIRPVFNEVIDNLNLDMEYEWYLHKAAGKEPVKKHSVVGKEANEQAGFQQYLQEITAVVK